MQLYFTSAIVTFNYFILKANLVNNITKCAGITKVLLFPLMLRVRICILACVESLWKQNTKLNSDAWKEWFQTN